SCKVSTISHEQQVAIDGLYRDNNSLLYGDNKPSDAAIDRVVDKVTQDLERRAKFSRKRPNEDEGDITYINERNKVFNKKVCTSFLSFY
ncbi:mRNA splicing factor SYF2, partial [Flagelloscypha sp. PMI_526]